MATTHLQKLRLFSRDVRLLLVTDATIGFCYYGIRAVLLNLYLLRLGYGPAFIGLVNGAGFLTFAVCGLPAGALGVRWGSRRTMIAGVGLIIVGFALLPLVELLPTALWAGWLVVTNLLTYLGGALWSVSITPLLTGATTSEERGHAFSVEMALYPLTGFAGNLVGGLLPGLLAASLGLSLDDPAPYRYPLLISAVIYGLVTLPAVIALGEVHAGSEQETAARTGKAPYALVAIVALTRLLYISAVVGVQVFLNVYLDAGLGTPTSLIGTLAAVGKMIAVPAAMAAPLVMERLGKPRTIVWGALTQGLSLLPLALLPHWGSAGLGLVGAMTADPIVGAASGVFTQEVVSPDWRPLMSGAVSMTWGLSSSIVAFAGGYVITGLGYRSFFLMAAAVTAVGAMLFWAYFRAPRGEFARTLEVREEGLPDGIG